MESETTEDIDSGARAQRLARRRNHASLHHGPSTPAAEGGRQADAALSLSSRDVFGGTEAHTLLPAAPGRDLPSAREDPEPSEPQERAPEEHEPRRDGSSEGRRALSSPGRREPAHEHVPDPREQTRQRQLAEIQAHGGREDNGRTEDGGYLAEGAGGDGGPAAPRGGAGTARTERTGRPAAQRRTPRPSTDEVSEGGLRGTDVPGVSPSRPRTQQSTDSDQMEEAEQPQGRRCQGQGGQRDSGRVREWGGMADERGDEGEEGG
ncbi:hypothetical protein B484DRAFT_117598, partial [Ochromonadaceae sp. CCMP2298]